MIYLLIPEEEVQKIEEERFDCPDPQISTGVKRGKERTRKFLHQIGMKPRKVGGIPAKADPQQQEDLKKRPGTRATRGQRWQC